MKTGDYVRTEYGIAKLQEITKRCIITDVLLDNSYSFSKDYFKILKSSPNIIDLIEVGDYVNGLKVEGVNNEIKGFGTIIFSKDSSIMEDYIYSIVTKEQFERMEYKVGK